MNPARVRWDDALGALGRQHRAEPGLARARRTYAAALSFAALYAPDHATGAARVAEALALEPLNPLHGVRAALLLMRFGRWLDAAARLEGLAQRVTDPGPLESLRALALLRAGESKRAANVAAAAHAAHPGRAAARFLEVDAFFRTQWKGTEARLAKLPRGDAHAAPWTDLLLKLAATHPTASARAVRAHVEQGVVPAGTPEARLLARALAWLTAAPEALADELATLAPGSRREQMALLAYLHSDRWNNAERDRLGALRALHRRLPERAGVRRVFVYALTRHAVAEARAERYPAALRAVEAALTLEPHETAHYQNRAALFTLMGETEAYHFGWAELDRHHYRLVLLGRSGPEAARLARRPHRMFAQQARLTPREPGRPVVEMGVLREETKRSESGADRVDLKVNQPRIEADPEQLRQWIHHRRAELFFSHLALGRDVGRVLLHPADGALGRARLDGIERLARSLAVLVPGEGEALAAQALSPWRAALPGVLPRYAPPADDAEAHALALAHTETLGDLCLLCLQYEPATDRADLVDDLVDTALAAAPFFDPAFLWKTLEDRERAAGRTVQLLGMYVVSVFGRGDGDPRPRLTDAQRARVVPSLCAALLCRLANEQGRDIRAEGAQALERALRTLDRARALDADDAAVEFFAARLLLIGEYFDETQTALARFHALATERDQPLRAEAESLQKVLDKRRAERGKGERRGAGAQPAAGTGDARAAVRGADRQNELEHEVERFPSAIAAYEALARLHLAEGRATEALAWAERAIGRCLSRDGQLRARALHLEATGLAALPEAHDAARLFLAGSTDALREAIEAAARAKGAPEALPYAVHYLYGRCLLDAKRPGDAGPAFAHAVARCERQIHLAVLRPLANDPEAAMVTHAAAKIADALTESRIDAAFRELAEVWSRCRAPEKCLTELARVQLAAVLVALGTGAEPVAPPRAIAAPPGTPWGAPLQVILAERDGLARTRGLCRLAVDLLGDAAARDAEAIARKVDALADQVRLAGAVREAAAHLQADRADEALTALDAVKNFGEAEPRWRRVQVLAFLRLGRFAEADASVAKLRGARDPAAVELLERYAEISFRHRITAATRHLRARDLEAAEAVLATTEAHAPEATLELVYCRAFALALRARTERDAGRREDALRTLHTALRLLDPAMPAARAAGHTRLAELYAQLDADVTEMEEGRR